MEAKSGTVFALTAVATLVSGLVGSSLVYAGEPAHSRDRCLTINLKTGAHTSPPAPFIEFVVPPVDSDHDGWFETVLKIRINDPAIRRSPKAARFVVDYGGVPTGMTVNIGDSKSNDGGGGDAGDQSNDAELQIGGPREEDPSLFDDLSVFGHDGLFEARGTQRIAQVHNIVRQGESVVLRVSNERLKYVNQDFPISGNIRSPWLFALNGQADTEGPVNHDIFAAFNRAISNFRLGSGVEKVSVCLVPQVELRDHDDDRDHEKW